MAASVRRSAILPVSIAMFALGLLAIIAIFALFAVGYENLPVWLNLATLLCPAGFIYGVVATVLRNRRR
ncbi:hypothetical protein SAMN02982929_07097 [Saccharopolyspora kobensis]|uniref:Uncharacterized protein n=1 Tax=Saccharopolyspora kobensis TaxID=146035 RepID=A0A1H6EKV6_9PSEU|nr:hypothetical protein [Saccharopolyspora kobensis]SEG98500.1 hypothetical protein SAMN02982929_07097 [Saccharopolyspora kobensis]SFF26360.1 hypothetical protein SAMN05216506_12425 [Saccharopolyspora kobensis]